jgi:hypothetical protein
MNNLEMSKARRVYLLIHTPTHMGFPVQMGFVPQENWSNALFDKYLAEVKRTREAGYSVTHLSKRDIERWGFFPPVGARVQVMEVEVPSQEWFNMWKKEDKFDLENPTIEAVYTGKTPEMR